MTSYPNIIILYKFKSILIIQSYMDKLSKLNQQLTQSLPLYGSLSEFMLLQINYSIQTFNHLYKGSSDRVLKAKKVSNRFTKQAAWLLSESAEQILELMESKLNIINDQTTDMNKKPRFLKIVSQLKQQYLLNPLQSTLQLPEAAVKWIKSLPNDHILPLYFTLKATIQISRQVVMEILAQRLGQLKMTYEESKDTVTMIFAGQFDQNKILEKFSTNFQNFKQITVNFAKKGMEIKVSKIELRRNFLAFVDKIIETIRQVSEKGSEQWDSAKLRTMSLYNSVLSRIKQKQVLIKTEYYKKPAIQLKQQVVSLPQQ